MSKKLHIHTSIKLEEHERAHGISKINGTEKNDDKRDGCCSHACRLINDVKIIIGVTKNVKNNFPLANTILFTYNFGSWGIRWTRTK